MKLRDIIEEIDVLTVSGSVDIEIVAVEFDSRRVAAGVLFVAQRGTVTDGHAYIGSAVAKGAAAVICEELPDDQKADVTYIIVSDSNVALGLAASAIYGHPSRQLKLVGITGTNGKTTTATLLYNLFRAAGHNAGLISTVSYCIGDREIVSTHTTPDAVRLNAMLAQMVEAGCEYCFMEVSSHSVVQHRISGLAFVGGVFTNITHDHLDYHKTFAEYIKAKKGFFDMLPASAFALTNSDDRNAAIMVQNCKARKSGYALRSMADFMCRIVESHLDGMLLTIGGEELWVRFIGRFNAYNLTAVYGTALLLGMDKVEALRIISTLTPVAGRFEYVKSADGIMAIVDYAHTPDALQNVLDTITELMEGRGKLITVVGCGGNRDKTKRPEMAAIAAAKSTKAILTSDNPRFEKPEDILADMQAGLDEVTRKNTLTITDRHEAIKTACALAGSGDIILVAGKGHEPYQEVEGVRHHFDDKEELQKCFEN